MSTFRGQVLEIFRSTIASLYPESVLNPAGDTGLSRNRCLLLARGDWLGAGPNLGRGPHLEDITNSLKDQLRRIAGVDLTNVAWLEVQTVQTIISGVGVDMSRWNTEKQFASWLGLCPDNSISGGKVLKRGTRHVVNRAATALPPAVWSLIRSQSALGANFRRLRFKLGAPKAITAMAHKLACLIYRMMRFGTEYVEKGMAAYESRDRQQQMKWLAKQAASLDL